MRLPRVGEVATLDVAKIDIDATLKDAVEKMCLDGHLNIIVENNLEYYLISVNDVLRQKIEQKELTTPIRELDLKQIPSVSKDTNIVEAIRTMGCSSEYASVINEDGTLFGIISHLDAASSVDPQTLMSNFCLNDFVNMGRRVRWVKKQMPTIEVLRDILERRSGGAMIVEDGKPVGIFTSRDVMRVVRKNLDISLPISAHMSSPVKTISNRYSISDALKFLKDKEYKRVVVVDEDGALLGMIDKKELLAMTYSRWASLVKEHQNELDELNKMLLDKSREFEHSASRDPLTQLYNRKKFGTLFEIALIDIRAREGVGAVAILDIDHFKKINDTHGHNVGDDVLVEMAEILKASVRSQDIVARWGGEEFVLFLPSVDHMQAKKILEKLIDKIERHSFAGCDAVTASVGVSKLRYEDDLRSAIGRADEALYMAKNGGRNQVVAI